MQDFSCQDGVGRFTSLFRDVLRIGVWLLCFLPTVVLGQVQVSEYSLSNSDIEVVEEGNQEFGSFRIVSADELEGAGHGLPPTWDMGGVDLFRLPEASANDSEIFVSDALIGPVWTHHLEQGSTALGNEKGGGQISLSQNAVSILEGNSKKIPLSVTCPISADVTVTISGYDGTDLSVEPTQLTFTNCNTKKDVTLTARQDGDAAHDDPIPLVLERSAGGSTGRETLTVTIYDDEIPLTFPPRFVQEGSPISLLVGLYPPLAPPSGDVTFTISGHEGTDLDPKQQELTFKLNNWQETKVLNLDTMLDTDDTDDTVTLTFTASGGGYSGLKYIAEITIADRRPFREYVPEGERILTKGYFIFTTSSFNPLTAITVTWSGFQGTDLILGQPVHMVKSNQWRPCITDDGPGYCTPRVPTEITAKHDLDEVDDEVDLVITGSPFIREGKPVSITGRVAVTIGDDDDPGIEINPSAFSINEGKTGTFKVKLSDAPLGDLGNNDVTVYIPSRDGDLTADPLRLTFTNDPTNDYWDEYQTVELTTYNDVDLVDDFRTLILEASGGGYDLERARLSVTIVDADEGALEVPDTVLVDEGSAKIFRVGLDHVPLDKVTVTISDFTTPDLKRNPDKLEFVPRDYLFQYRVGIDATNYQVTDDETHKITLTATGGGYDTQSEVTVIVKNKPDPTIKRLIVEPESITVARDDSATFEVSLSVGPERLEDVIVTIPSLTKSGLTRKPDALRFKFFNSRTPQTVTISADENATDGLETLTLTAKGGGYDNVTADVPVTVENTDLVGASLVVAPTTISVDEGNQETFDVSLSVQPTADVTVMISAFTNSYPTLTPETLTFTTSNYDTAQPVMITAKPDSNAIDESESLTLTASGGGYDSITKDVTVTVNDDDEANLVINPTSVSVFEGSEDEFEVSLSAQPSGDVIVTIPAFTNSDLTRDPETLTFTSSNYGTSRPVTVKVAQDDNLSNESETLTLTASGGEYDGVTGEVDVEVLDPHVRLLATPLIVSEGGTVTLTVEVSEVMQTNLSIPLIYEETGEDPATEDVDYEGPSSILILAGKPKAEGQITVENDETSEADETFQVKLGKLPSELDPKSPNPHTITILNDDEPPPIQARLSLKPNSVNEGESVTVTATLPRALDDAVTIPVQCTALGTTDPDDYQCPFNITIPVGKTSADELIRTTVDPDTEDEQVSVALGTNPIIEIGPPSSITLTILDTTPAVVTLSVSPREVTEGETVEITVTISTAPLGAVRIPIECSSTENYEYECPSEIRIPAGETSGSINFLIQDDEVAEDDETFTVALGNVLPPDTEAGDPSSLLVTIRDNDRAGINLSTSSLTVVEGTSEVYRVNLESEPLAPVTLEITGLPPRVVQWNPPVLTFTSTDWDIPQDVTVEALPDDDTDSEQAILTHTAKSSDPNYSGLTESLRVNVTDKDIENLVIQPQALFIPEGSFKVFTVALATEPSGMVTVQVPSFLNSDLSRNPELLTFTPSNWDKEESVRVFAAEDDDAEPSDPETITLVASGGGYDGIQGMVTVTIEETDKKGITLNPTSITIEEGGDPKTYEVSLTSAPTSNVTVTISGQGEKATLDPASVMFTASDWRTPKTVRIQAVEDPDPDDETLTLLHTASGGGYDNERAELDLRIQDKGLDAITVSIYDAQGNEQDEGVDLRVELNRSTELPVSVRFETIAGTAETDSDYVRSRGIVLFDPGSKRGKIHIDLINDEIPEPDERFTVELSGPSNAEIGRPVGQVTIIDDDGSATTVRIDDAVITDADPMVRFMVRVSAPSAVPILVHYRTENRTANAGEDYHALAGVLTFAPGEMTQEITVDVVQQHQSQRKTFAVRLESVSEGTIEKAVAVATIQEDEDAAALEVMEAYTARFVRTSTIQIVDALRNRPMGSSCAVGQRAELVQVWGIASKWAPSLGELLAGCRLLQEQERGRGWLSIWGQGAFTRFQGRGDDALDLRGEVTTAMLGTDYRWQSGWLAGVVVTRSQGDGTYRVLDTSGQMEASLTGVVPYVSVQGVDWGAWLALGYGRGQAEVERLEGGLASVFGAAGVQGKWITRDAGGLEVHGDVLVAGAEVNEHEVRGEVVRVRVGLQGNLRLHETLRPYVEANVRQDGGSAETGIGLELGGGLRFASGPWKAELRTQGLVMHSADGFIEWGTSGFVQFGGGPTGWTMSIRPSWGPSHGSSLHRQQTILDATRSGQDLQRTEVELAYGVPLKVGVARSVVGMTQLSTGRMYRMGTEMRPWDRMSFSIFGLAHSRRELGLNVRGTLNY